MNYNKPVRTNCNNRENSGASLRITASSFSALMRAIAFAAAVSILPFISVAVAAAETVFVSETGSKYHRESCSSLRYSKSEMQIESAWSRGYRPCSNCKPPLPAEEVMAKNGGGHKFKITLVRTVNGDTIRAMVNGKEEVIRYIGIDAPEMNHTKKESPQPYAVEAMEFNARILEDKALVIELDVQERDRYGRLLAYVFAQGDEGEFMVNIEFLLQGMAAVLTVPPNVKYVDKFLEAQRMAQKKGIGIWRER